MDHSQFKQIFIFKVLTTEDADLLLNASSIQTYSAGTVLFYEGDVSDHFLIVLEGSIEIVRSMGTDIERLIKVAGVNDFLGEMSVVGDEKRRTASARTPHGVRVLAIPMDELDAFLRHNPALSYEMMRVITQRMRENDSQIIQDLRQKNQQLMQSLKDLQEAQEQIIAQEKLEAELATARRIQQSMLPIGQPSLPGWRLASYWQPARAVSGDFYEFIHLPDGRLAIILGDVSDKGVPAALVMTVTISMLRAAAANSHSPGALLARVNHLLCNEAPMGMFVTCHVSFLDPASGQMSMASAGQCRPLLRHNGEVLELETRGMALGISPDESYAELSVQIRHGDTLLYYSDGLTEAHNPQGEMLGVAQVKLTMSGDSADLLPTLVERLNIFTQPAVEPEDDVTLISLVREEAG